MKKFKSDLCAAAIALFIIIFLAGCGLYEDGEASVSQVSSRGDSSSSERAESSGSGGIENSTSATPEYPPDNSSESFGGVDSSDSKSTSDVSSSENIASSGGGFDASSEIVFSDPLDDPRIDDGWTSGWR